MFNKPLNEITDSTKELFSKACDGGYADGCKNYTILNKKQKQ